MSAPIQTSANAQYYANGRGLARYQGQKPLAVEPPWGTPTYWSNEGVKDVWGGVPSRIGTETVWLGPGGAAMKVVGGPDAAPNPWTSPVQPTPTPTQPPAYQRRDAPVYQPRPGQSGQSYYIPPPPQPPVPVPVSGNKVVVTYELYGRMNGRQVPIWKELSFDGVTFHIKQGGRVLISHNASEGYGYAGTPGKWAELYGNRSPVDWGLDPDRGVVAFDGTRAFAVPVSQLVEIFGDGWRQTVYA